MMFNDTDDMHMMLEQSSTIAVVGFSPNPARPSHQIGLYLRDAGYRVIPVNPGHAQIAGMTCYRRLSDIPEPVDLINIFRRSEEVASHVDEAIAAQVKFVWAQQGIFDETAGNKAIEAGLRVVMDRCIMVEHSRWKGEAK